MNKRTWTIIGWFLFIAAILVTVFLHIDHCGIYRWDESRNAMNALEMSEGGNPLVRTIFGHPDHWETKPPLLIWLQVISIKILGISELSIRFPSALAGLSLAGLLLIFFKRHTRNLKAGIFSVLILFTSGGYVRPHVLRSGDHDALLILWLTSGLLFYFLYLQSSGHGWKGKPGRGKYLVWTGISIAAAILTKSITGLFFLPGMLLYTALTGKLAAVLRSKWLYISIAGVLIIVAGYYLGRTYFDPEYLYWVSENELFKRYFNTSQEYSYNEPSWSYYLQLLKDLHFNIWIWALPLAAVPLIMPRDPASGRLAAYLALNSVVFLLIISLGTSNDWYDAPLIPMLSMLLGLSFSRIYELAVSRWRLQGAGRTPIFILSCALIFSYPFYQSMERQVYRPAPQHTDMAYGNFLRSVEQSMPMEKQYSIISECNNNHTDLYVKIYNEYKGYALTNNYICSDDPTAEIRALEAGALYALCSENYLETLSATWTFEMPFAEGDCLLVRLISLK